jgi:serine/threonine protein kinase
MLPKRANISSLAGPPLPRVIGHYEIREELEGGTAARSYRGSDVNAVRSVVVRIFVLASDLPQAVQQDIQAHFLGEARRASRVSHPGLVAIYDFGRDDATTELFVVEEDAPGTFLSRTLVAGQPLPGPQAWRLVAGIGRALEPLHAAGLGHGAVRPDNILLVGPGVPKLADRGLSRFIPAPPREVFASPLYLSPERAMGQPVDASSDIFGLGAVAYRLLTGRDAFEADTSEGVLARVVHDRPQRPSAIVPGLSIGVDHVLWQALAKARKERYATAARFCEDIDDLLADRPPRHALAQLGKVNTSRMLAAGHGEPGEGIGTGSHRLERRRPWVRALVGLLALTLVAGLELLRREIERPGGTPAGLPTVKPRPKGGDASGDDIARDLPSLEEHTPSARLALDFEHTLEKGSLVLILDGGKVLERRFTGVATKSFLGIKLREGRLRQVIEVPPGRHQIRVRVRWSGDERSETLTGDFAAGATRKLTARLGRIGKPLSVEWR